MRLSRQNVRYKREPRDISAVDAIGSAKTRMAKIFKENRARAYWRIHSGAKPEI